MAHLLFLPICNFHHRPFTLSHSFSFFLPSLIAAEPLERLCFFWFFLLGYHSVLNLTWLFSSGVSSFFPIHSLGCLELDAFSSFFIVRLYVSCTFLVCMIYSLIFQTWPFSPLPLKAATDTGYTPQQLTA